MSQVDKMFYNCKKKFKLFGIPFFEIEDVTSRFDGKGEFVTETIPNKEYFEKEFVLKKV